MTYLFRRSRLVEQLQHRSPAVRAQAVDEVGLHRDHAFLFAVLDNVKTTDEELGLATAFALSRFQTRAARTGLLHLLHHPRASVVLAAIEALSAIGTAEEIEHLRALTAGILRDRKVQRAARTAIEAIQKRTHGSRGALSMARNEGGTLALS
jgi:HEAT repeat protein